MKPNLLLETLKRPFIGLVVRRQLGGLFRRGEVTNRQMGFLGASDPGGMQRQIREYIGCLGDDLTNPDWEKGKRYLETLSLPERVRLITGLGNGDGS